LTPAYLHLLSSAHYPHDIYTHSLHAAHPNSRYLPDALPILGRAARARDHPAGRISLFALAGQGDPAGSFPGHLQRRFRRRARTRSEEHTSELQTREKLASRLLPEKKNIIRLMVETDNMQTNV